MCKIPIPHDSADAPEPDEPDGIDGPSVAFVLMSVVNHWQRPAL